MEIKNIGFFTCTLELTNKDRIFLSYAKTLVNKGFTVKVFGLRQSQIEKECREENIRFVPILDFISTWDFGSARRWAKIFKEEKIQSLQINDYNCFPIFNIIKKFYFPRLHLHYFHFSNDHKKKISPTRLRMFKKVFIPWISQVNEHKKWKRTEYLPIGVNEIYFDQVFTKKESRKFLDLPNENEIIFGIMGRFSSMHNQLLAIEALLQANLHTKLLLCGDALPIDEENYYLQMQQFIMDKNLAMRVYLRKTCKERHFIYKSIDGLLITSSDSENDLFALESLACGTPIIQAKQNHKIEKDKVYCLSYEDENADSLAMAMDKLSININRYDTLTIQTKMEGFRLSNVMEKLECHFKTIKVKSKA